jgi:hypothetical protein
MSIMGHTFSGEGGCNSENGNIMPLEYINTLCWNILVFFMNTNDQQIIYL